MLSRTAESLFWIGRYLERAQNLARIVDIALQARLERFGGPRAETEEWDALLTISGERERFLESGQQLDDRSVAWFLTFDSDNPSSIRGCVQRARENANALRERITSEMWETLNTFHLWLAERALLHEVNQSNLSALYGDIKEHCFLFEGVTDGTMTHDEGMQFLRVGKFLERASMTARILDVQYPLLQADDLDGSPTAVHQWIWLLRSLSAYEAYCKAHHLGIRAAQVAEFIIFDQLFPRSIRFAVASAEASLKRVSESPPGRYADSAERVLGWMNATLSFGDQRELVDGRLRHFLTDIQQRCAEVSTELADIYFAYHVANAEGA